jgi:hypothetical protein
MSLNTTGWNDDETQFCVYTLSGLSCTDIEDLVVPEASQRENISHHRCLQINIYIFQAWYRELLVKDEWNNDTKIFDLDWGQYDQFCHEYKRDKVTTIQHQQCPKVISSLWTPLQDGTREYDETQAISLH